MWGTSQAAESLEWWDLPTGTNDWQTSQGLNVFISLYNSLYIKYNSPLFILVTPLSQTNGLDGLDQV